MEIIRFDDYDTPSKSIMQRAIDLAKQNKGGHAVAAIIVKNGEIISEAYTTLNIDKDPTCHAEINAIRMACKKLNSRFLDGCVLYTTFEPCPMCTSAAIWAKMKGIVYGASMEDETEKCPQRIKINCSEIINRGTPKLELYQNFMREECTKLLIL